jgi:type VI secretion system protein ImpB
MARTAGAAHHSERGAVMSDGSVAPKERISIVYQAATGSGTEEKELPLKLLMMGDYSGRDDHTPLEDRKPIGIGKDNFDEVMASRKIAVETLVPNELTERPGEELAVRLRFAALRDFGPESIARQVPELAQLLALREALSALKGPLGDLPAFRAKIEELVGDERSRAALLEELGRGG